MCEISGEWHIKWYSNANVDSYPTNAAVMIVMIVIVLYLQYIYSVSQVRIS
jgi:hypothetical protein